jgi:hypothetical protein
VICLCADPVSKPDNIPDKAGRTGHGGASGDAADVSER